MTEDRAARKAKLAADRAAADARKVLRAAEAEELAQRTQANDSLIGAAKSRMVKRRARNRTKQKHKRERVGRVDAAAAREKARAELVDGTFPSGAADHALVDGRLADAREGRNARKAARRKVGR